MAKARHIEDAIAKRMKNPVFAAAFRERRLVQEIALKVRSLREAHGLTQAQLANLVGTKQPAIARLETSQSQAPKWSLLFRIAYALDKQLQLTFIDRDDDAPLVRVQTIRGKSKASPKRATETVP